jgi:alanine-glyoxylate transaminase/serine-glyoxylate transaminase/serine-pyruvate transaminase
MMSEKIEYSRLNPPERTLLGPDLSNASPRARQGLIATLEGASDPQFLKVLNLAYRLLRELWGTQNRDTFIIPGSEENALEAGLLNVLEPGDVALVCVSGFFGERMAQTAEQIGAKVIRLVAAPGRAVRTEELHQALKKHQPRLCAFLHGDGSTGIQQPLDNLGEVVHEAGALLLVDARWTFGALDLNVDQYGIDICVAGSQKTTSAYPGLGLITFNSQAVQAYENRHVPVPNWSLDLKNLREYQTDERAAQTFPAPILYALTEMLQLSYEQGMAYRIQRHVNRRDALVAGLEALNLNMYAHPDYRLPTVTAIRVPEGIDQDSIRKQLLTPYRIDIGGGLGDLQGKLWRVGVMSHSAQPTYLLAFITLLEIILEKEGYPIPAPGTAARTLLTTLDP